MTSRELAALAGVSQSTVSRVLNGRQGVSREKQQKVLEMARNYRFELDVNARGLRTKKPGRVGVLLSRSFIGFDVNLFWATIYSRLHVKLLERGYTSLPIYGYHGSEKEVLNRLIQQKQTDRMILVSTNGFYLQEDLQILFERNIPFVLTGMRVGLGVAWSTIIGAEMLAATAGLGYLINLCRGIYRPDIIIASMICVGVIGAALGLVLTFVEKQLMKGGRW